jgi:transcription elongation GreA/GreB family factor
MYKLKLYNDWESKLKERIDKEKEACKYGTQNADLKASQKKCSNTAKKIKEINEIISKANIIEQKEDYIIYGLGR